MMKYTIPDSIGFPSNQKHNLIIINKVYTIYVANKVYI